MSELIDRIYDVEKISKEVADVVAGIEKSITAIDGFKKAVEELEKSTRKSKGTEELINNTKLLNDNVVKGGIEMKRYEAEVQKLKEKTEQLTNSEKAASIEIAKARLELQAAQKATKEAAIAEIELTAANGKVSTSYTALQKELTNSIKAYKSLEESERNSAKGTELLKKINETQTSLKKTDASMGNYQRNVGNYASALEGLTPRLGGLAGTLLDIARSAAKSRDELNEMGGDNGLGIMANPRIPAGLATIMTGIKGIGQSVLAMGKAVLANPIIAVLAAVIFIFKQVSNAISESEDRTNKLSEATARFKPILRTIGDVFEVIADVVIGYVEVLGKAYSAVMEFLGINPKGSADQFVKAEKLKQKAVIETRALNEDSAKQEAIIAEQRAILADKENYNYSQRKAALKIAGEAEQKLANDRAKIAKINYNAIKAEADLDDQNAEMKDKVSTATIAMNNAAKESAGVRRKLGKEAQKLSAENIADLKAEAEAAEAASQKIIAARRRLVDSSFAIQKDSQEKQLALNAENLKRELEDTKASGQLKANLIKASEIEANKIKNEWQVKRLNDTIKADELTLENMKKSGQSTLEFEKQILQDRMQAEILAGGNVFDIKQKYKFLELDLEAKTADEKVALFEKELKKQADILTAGYDEQELALKKAYAEGKMSRKEYERQLAEIQLKGLKELNDKTIELLEKELKVSGLSDDKKAELSNKLAKLKIDNENAVTDAVIKNNEEQVKSDDDAKAKRVEVAKALASAGAEIFGAIAEYEKQRSEEKIKEYEAELDANDLKFEKEQSNLDNAIMSDEMRAEKQNEINEKKFAADQVIQDKIKAEKVKQAKWEKANAIIQAIITNGLAILNAALSKPFLPMGLIAVGLATTLGAIQVATIASQPIPAFEKGGVTGDGLALWGEARPEVAVTPSGDVMLAEKPTITDFDAGTRIYKSIADYELAMGGKNGGSFKFDYDKMGEKMKSPTINLDSNGLWSIVSKQNERMTLVNRRYRLN